MQLILEGSSNRELVRNAGTMKMEQAMNSPAPCLHDLGKQHGKEKVEKVLGVLIAETAAYFDGEMGSGQALDIAAEITGRYAGFKMEDIWVCLNELKSSEIYGKLTSNKVLSALRQYFDRRMEAAGRQSLNKHLAGQGPRRDSSEAQKFKEFKHRWALEKIKKATQ